MHLTHSHFTFMSPRTATIPSIPDNLKYIALKYRYETFFQTVRFIQTERPNMQLKPQTGLLVWQQQQRFSRG